MLVECDKTNLYSKITNKNYSTARDYMASTYGEPRVKYYNAQTKEEEETKKRHHKRYIALIVALLAINIGLLRTVFLKGKKIDLSQIEEFGKVTQEKVKNMKIKEKAVNSMSNFNNIKDDYFNKATEKMSQVSILKTHPFSFFTKLGKKATDIYKLTVRKAFESEWNEKAEKVIQQAKREGVDLNIDNFEKWYTSLSNGINDKLHVEGERITDNLINKDILNKVTTRNIADTKIRNVALDAAKKIEIPQKASWVLAEDIEEFNEYKLKTASTIVPKLRDINLGSAPTDILNQTIALLSLATAVVTSDTKEEKQSVIINLGIPLLTTLSTTTFATFKAISGASALAFGLITGEMASIIAKFLSKTHAKIQEKKENKA